MGIEIFKKIIEKSSQIGYIKSLVIPTLFPLFIQLLLLDNAFNLGLVPNAKYSPGANYVLFLLSGAMLLSFALLSFAEGDKVDTTNKPRQDYITEKFKWHLSGGLLSTLLLLQILYSVALLITFIPYYVVFLSISPIIVLVAFYVWDRYEIITRLLSTDVINFRYDKNKNQMTVRSQNLDFDSTEYFNQSYCSVSKQGGHEVIRFNKINHLELILETLDEQTDSDTGSFSISITQLKDKMKSSSSHKSGRQNQSSKSTQTNKNS